MSVTANSRQMVGDQVKRAQRTMLLCKILCTALFVVAGYLVVFLTKSGHQGLILLLLFGVAVVIAALVRAYSAAEGVISTSASSFQYFERVENLR